MFVEGTTNQSPLPPFRPLSLKHTHTHTLSLSLSHTHTPSLAPDNTAASPPSAPAPSPFNHRSYDRPCVWIRYKTRESASSPTNV
jgi:hypothetical protein